ncbi:MAG: hypothetical protein WAS73_02905 [Defluviicoccus sp.]
MTQADASHTAPDTAHASREPVDLDNALFKVGDAIEDAMFAIKTAISVLDLVCEAQKYENLSFDHVYYITEQILGHLEALKRDAFDPLHDVRKRIRAGGGLLIA